MIKKPQVRCGRRRGWEGSPTHGRVVAGTTAQRLAGSLTRQAPLTLPGGVSLTSCGTLPLTVLTWP
ncbi:MAG TPA: hypothetical protein VN408_29250 [Actinoplanes sp.]|nr:hypothetical protein [Actinoplanes sp.]